MIHSSPGTAALSTSGKGHP